MNLEILAAGPEYDEDSKIEKYSAPYPEEVSLYVKKSLFTSTAIIFNYTHIIQLLVVVLGPHLGAGR